MADNFVSAIKEGVGVVFGSAAGVFVALFGLVGLVLGAVVDPVAAAIASGALLAGLVALFVYALRQRSLSEAPIRFSKKRSSGSS